MFDETQVDSDASRSLGWNQTSGPTESRTHPHSGALLHDPEQKPTSGKKHHLKTGRVYPAESAITGFSEYILIDINTKKYIQRYIDTMEIKKDK